MKFTGTEKYVATDDLRMAVDAAVALQRPLLIKGEPGGDAMMIDKYQSEMRDLDKKISAQSAKLSGGGQSVQFSPV